MLHAKSFERSKPNLRFRLLGLHFKSKVYSSSKIGSSHFR